MLDDKNHLVDETTWTDKKGTEQTEPEYFVHKPKYSKQDLIDNQYDTTSLGMGSDYKESENESEPSILVHPGEGTLDV